MENTQYMPRTFNKRSLCLKVKSNNWSQQSFIFISEIVFSRRLCCHYRSWYSCDTLLHFLKPMLNISSQICDLVILQEITSPTVPVSSERVSEHRHSDEERASPVWAAAEATYILSGIQQHSKGWMWACSTDLLHCFSEVPGNHNLSLLLFFCWRHFSLWTYCHILKP